MRITSLLQADSVLLGASTKNKLEAIERLISLQAGSGCLIDVNLYRTDILAREAEGVTAVGRGIAVPHAKSAAVKRPSLAAMTLSDGVVYGAPDGELTRLLFMIAVPWEGDRLHLRILARLMKLLMHEDFRSELLTARTPEEFLAAIDAREQETFPGESGLEQLPEGVYRVVAVTACPTGIAQAYMAAEALEQAGRAIGIPVKAEIHGSAGVQNKLTQAEIDACVGVIAALGRELDLTRFADRPLFRVPVSDAVIMPEALVRAAEAGKVGMKKRR